MEKWVNGPVALIGDAAHAIPPNLHQGAALAMEDALVLSRTLSDPSYPTVVESLEVYNVQRKERVEKMQDIAWISGGNRPTEAVSLRVHFDRMMQPFRLGSWMQKSLEKKLTKFK